MTTAVSTPVRQPSRARQTLASLLMGLGLLLLLVALMSAEKAHAHDVPFLVVLALLGGALFVLGGVLSGKGLSHWISLDVRLF